MRDWKSRGTTEVAKRDDGPARTGPLSPTFFLKRGEGRKKQAYSGTLQPGNSSACSVDCGVSGWYYEAAGGFAAGAGGGEERVG